MVKQESPMLGGFFKKSQDLHPDLVYDGKSADVSVNAGVPIPYLSLMYLLNSTVLSLSKTLGLAGPAMSQKSSLGYEFIRLIHRYHGVGVLIDSEGNKFNPILIRSILGDAMYDDRNRFTILSAPDAEMASKHLNSLLSYFTDNEVKQTPCALVLDSLYGTPTEGMVDTMQREGFLKADYARVASQWTRTLQAFVPQLIGWPILFVFTNHLKDVPAVVPGMPPGKTTPGGVAQRFYAANYIYMKRKESRQVKTAEEDGEARRRVQEIRTLELKLDKTSLAIDKRKINVDFLWWYRDDTDRHQVTQFDWDSATTHLLFEEQSNADNTGKALKSVLDLRENKKRYSSDALKMKDATAYEIGSAIHANQPLMDALVDFMHIQRNPVWPGIRLTPEPKAPTAEKPEKPPKPEKPAGSRDGGIDMG